jgi:hypothetical protein
MAIGYSLTVIIKMVATPRRSIIEQNGEYEQKEKIKKVTRKKEK